MELLGTITTLGTLVCIGFGGYFVGYTVAEEQEKRDKKRNA